MTSSTTEKDNIRTSSPHDAPQNGYLVRKSLCMTDNKKTGVYTSRQGFTYRLAFTYLDYAEANNEAYDTSAARELCLKYLNKVRDGQVCVSTHLTLSLTWMRILYI